MKPYLQCILYQQWILDKAEIAGQFWRQASQRKFFSMLTASVPEKTKELRQSSFIMVSRLLQEADLSGRALEYASKGDIFTADFFLGKLPADKSNSR